jgi:hypothetical protein
LQKEENELEELSDLSEDEEASPIHQPPPDAGVGLKELAAQDDDPSGDEVE